MSLLGCLLAAFGCEGKNAAQPAPNPLFLLDANPSRMDLGEVAPGGCKQATFTLMNRGTRTIELARIDSSCDCLAIDVPMRVTPGEQVVGRAKVDLRDDLSFTGELAIEIKGLTRAGEAAFLVTVAVHVPRPSNKR